MPALVVHGRPNHGWAQSVPLKWWARTAQGGSAGVEGRQSLGGEPRQSPDPGRARLAPSSMSDGGADTARGRRPRVTSTKHRGGARSALPSALSSSLRRAPVSTSTSAKPRNTLWMAEGGTCTRRRGGRARRCSSSQVRLERPTLLGTPKLPELLADAGRSLLEFRPTLGSIELR